MLKNFKLRQMKNTVNYKIWIVALFLVITGSCSIDDDQYTTWPEPTWSVESPELLPNSFTAIVAIPDNVNVYASDNDQVAAFIDGECHGVGTLVKDEDSEKRVYFLTIRASDTESGEITFKYYNANLSYLYQAEETIDFEADGTYGSYDSPIILNLQIVE